MHLFEPNLIKAACLIASDSPRQAFYNKDKPFTIFGFLVTKTYTQSKKKAEQKERPGTCNYGDLICLKRLRKILSA